MRIILLRFFTILLLVFNVIKGIIYFDWLGSQNEILDNSTIEIVYDMCALLSSIVAFLLLGIIIHYIYYKKEISKWELGIASLLVIFELTIIGMALVHSI